VLAALVLLATGCGQPKGELFPLVDPPVVWPPAPEPARIEYVGQLTTTADLKPARSFFQGMGEALFGREDVRSMLTPYALCIDDADRLFVCDSNAQVVHVFDLERRTYETWRPPEEAGSFAQPVGIAIDELGHLLVADSVAGTVFAFDRRGRYLGDFDGEHVIRPTGLAVDRHRHRVFIADPGAHQVVVLAPDGELLHRLGTRGTELGQFNFPTNVAVDATGRLYVSDSLNFRVQVFDPDLEPLRQIGEQGDLPGYFSRPRGIALDASGHVYVVDAHFEAVQIFDPDGRLLLSFGREGSGPGEFWLPAGIHIDLQNRIWIADCYNRRVQVFQYRTETTETP
jgi:DNA-binding beta-propeller fold protein YncE